MIKVNSKSGAITCTQGDTFEATIHLTIGEDEYVPAAGDKIRFAIKSSYDDPEPIFTKDISTDTMTLRIEANETKLLHARKKPYVYDIQLSTPSGFVSTFMDRKQWYSTEEVD